MYTNNKEENFKKIKDALMTNESLKAPEERASESVIEERARKLLKGIYTAKLSDEEVRKKRADEIMKEAKQKRYLLISEGTLEDKLRSLAHMLKERAKMFIVDEKTYYTTSNISDESLEFYNLIQQYVYCVELMTPLNRWDSCFEEVINQRVNQWKDSEDYEENMRNDYQLTMKDLSDLITYMDRVEHTTPSNTGEYYFMLYEIYVLYRTSLF